MFLGTHDLSAEILTVLELKWDSVDANAGYRPFHCIALHLMGDATIYSDCQEPVEEVEGEIVFAPAEFEFSKRAGPGHIIAIHFLCDAPLPFEILHFLPRNQDFFRQAFLQIYEVWSKKQFGYQYESKMLFYRILFEMEREYSRQQPSLANEKLSAALRKIHTDFTHGDLRVEELARMCGMSDTYFRRLFVQEFGVTPVKYINRLRLERITEMLQSSYYTVEEVSEACGFNNVNYFSLFVKKETGMPPSVYRTKLLKKEG